MGRENTIQTGTTSGGGRSRSTTNTSISNNSGLVNTGLGRVTKTFGDKSIEYISLNNQYGYTKKGYAVPFDPNIANVPPTGSSVLLISAPLSNIDENDVAQFGGRKTFYSLIINSNSNVGGTNVDTTGTGGGYVPPISTGTADVEANKLIVKNYCKEKGLSAEQTAAIMGNIMAECGFEPNNKFADINGLESYGIIQWNGSRNGSGRGFDLNKIPPDIKGQLDILFDASFTPTFAKWVNETNSNPTGTNSEGMSGPEYLAYLFAKSVEVCYNCTKGIAIYKDPSSRFNPIRRSTYALAFFNSFNDGSNVLAWNGIKAPYNFSTSGALLNTTLTSR